MFRSREQAPRASSSSDVESLENDCREGTYVEHRSAYLAVDAPSTSGPDQINSPENSAAFKLKNVGKYIIPQNPYRELVKDIPRRGLFNMTLHNPVRKLAILIVKSRIFEIFILLVILVNCVFMGLQSNQRGFASSNLGKFLARAEIFFTVVFASEMALKIIALGFVIRKGSYLRDGFNVLDFIVVVLSFANYLPGVGNYTAVRAVRVLRPLRTITRIKGMRQLVLTLLNSIPLLLDVAVLCAFVFFVYGIVSVQLFGGALLTHCAEPIFNETIVASLAPNSKLPSSAVSYFFPAAEQNGFCTGPYDKDVTWFVNKYRNGTYYKGGSKGSGRVCPAGLICATGQNPSSGFVNFDNILWAWLNVFIMITLDGWSGVLYDLQDGLSNFVWPFFVTLIFISTYFMMNLALAVLYTHFQKESEIRKKLSVELAAERDATLRREMAAAEKRKRAAQQKLMGREHSAPPGSPPDPPQPEAAPSTRGGKKLTFMRSEPAAEHASRHQSPAPEVSGTATSFHSPLQRSRTGHSLPDRSYSVAPMQRAAGLEQARTVYVDMLKTHSEWRQSGITITLRHRISLIAYRLLCQRWFDGLMTFLIVLNTVMMAAQHYQQSQAQTDFSNYVNYIITGVFALEMVIKHCAYGFKLYWTHGYDVFDGLILFASIVDIVVSAAQHNSGASALSALRSLRLLRVLKLARSWKELQRVIDAVLRSVGSIGYLSLLVFLFMTVFALLGMQLFGEKLQFCDDVTDSFQACPIGEQCPRYHACYVDCDASELDTWIYAEGSPFNSLALCEVFPRNATAYPGVEPRYLGFVGHAYVPRFMFDTFFFSMVTVFACIAQDGWSNIMFDAMRSINGPGRYVASVYFILLLVIGLYILLNLFLAILLDGFSVQSDGSKSGHEGLSILFSIREKLGSLGGRSSVIAKSKKLLTNLRRSASWGRSRSAKTITRTVSRNDEDEQPLSAPTATSRAQDPNALARVSESGEPSRNSELGGRRVSFVGKAALSGAQDSIASTITSDNGAGRPSRTSDVGLPRGPNSESKGEDERDADAASASAADPSRRPSARVSQPPTLEDQILALKGTSLFLFKTENKFRLFIARVVFHRMFDVFIMCIIVGSSLALALDSPQLNPHSPMKKHLATLDIVFTSLFAAEAVMKIVALGFILHEKSYMRNAWNLLDIAVVVIGIVLEALPSKSNVRNVRPLRVLRTLRALRPLRLISWNAGMRIVVNALFQSIPPLGDVLMVCVLVYFIFGVVGINLFSGMFYECIDLDSRQPLDPQIYFPPGMRMTKDWCEANGGWHVFNTFPYHYNRNLTTPLPDKFVIQTQWNNPPTNFDHIGNALLTLYEIASLELWEVVMWRGMDVTQTDEQPSRDSNYLNALFFMLFVVFGAFFILNLFVGVVIDKFNELKKKAEGQSLMLTEEQQRWVEIQKLMAIVGPKRTYVRPTNKFRAWCYDVILSPRTETFIIVLVILNVLQMSFEWYNSPYVWTRSLSYINLIFTGAFVVEAILKLSALGPTWYFRDRLNQFDFIIVVVSVLTIMLDYGPDGKPSSGRGGAGVNLLRIFRIARILRLIPRARGLRTLIQTLLFSLPALWNVGSVLFMFFFIFAVMGMQLFGMTVGGDNLTNKTHFNNFPTALLTLFRTITGENWPGLMHDAAGDTVMKECIQMLQDCTPDTIPSCGASFYDGLLYLPADIKRFGVSSDITLDRCPANRIIAILYFCVFTVLCGFILINLVIAIVLDSFRSSNVEESLPISKQHMSEYVETWAQFDTQGTGYIPARKLPALIAELPYPMGAKNSAATLADIQMIIMTSDIPNRDGKVHFFETLHSLSARVAGTDLPWNEQIKVHSKLSSKLPRNVEDTKHTVAHYHAALYVQAAVRGMLARQAVKQHLESLFSDPAYKAEYRASRASNSNHGTYNQISSRSSRRTSNTQPNESGGQGQSFLQYIGLGGGSRGPSRMQRESDSGSGELPSRYLPSASPNGQGPEA